MASWGGLLTVGYEGRKNGAWIINQSAQWVGSCPKWAAAKTVTLRDGPENSRKGTDMQPLTEHNF